jgi:alpha-beta hydrolase superfamily lysophospholipase
MHSRGSSKHLQKHMHDSTLEELLMPPQVSSAAEARQFSSQIADRHGFLTSPDGTSLFYRHWPADSWNGRVVIVLHGIGFHSGPYKVIADALNPAGIDVYGLDARSHGLSQGRRGFLATPAQVQADVLAMIHTVRQQRAVAKIFLVGDSLGANLVLNYAKSDGRELTGLVLLAPALNLHPSQYLRLESARLFPNVLYALRKPVISLVGGRLEESTRNASFVASRRTDPLAYKNVSFGYLLDGQRLVWDWRWAIAPKVKTPTLIVKGDSDRVISHERCVEFHERLAAPDKQLGCFPDVHHTTLWDPHSEQILEFILGWVMAR